MQIIITMPIYEDTDSATELCQKIDLVFSNMKSIHVSLLLIDDGSTSSPLAAGISLLPEAIESISVLTLRRNLGHQRAIAIGLAFIQQHLKCDAVVVMDAEERIDQRIFPHC